MIKRDKPVLHLTGHCDCQSVAVTVAGPTVSMFQCACENCQRAGGGGHSNAALFRADAVTIVGETKAYARPADSGATFTRHFCITCGATVCAVSSRASDLRILPVGLFAGHNDWFAPTQVIFARSHRDWDLLADALPRHQRYRESTP